MSDLGDLVGMYVLAGGLVLSGVLHIRERLRKWRARQRERELRRQWVQDFHNLKLPTNPTEQQRQVFFDELRELLKRG